MVPHDLETYFMHLLLRLFPLRILLLSSAVLLLILNVFSFYSLFVNKFSFSKFDNYIFPCLTIVHFVYLYTLWTKNKTATTASIFVRNIEYTLYFIYMIYIFKFSESIYRLSAYTEFDKEIIPKPFIPIGIILVLLHFLLLLLTLLSFSYRRNKIGKFNFDELHEPMETWKK